jgi:Family of unknown function (DUF5906)
MSPNRKGGFTAKISTPAPEGIGVKIDDFVAYMPAHNYIFTPCREPWPASAVNARLKRIPVLTKSGKPKRDKDGKLVTMLPSRWLDKNRPVEQMTWCPGLPMLIKDRLVVLGGWIERKNVTCFNLYRPPRLVLGDASKAGPWISHFKKIYPDDADHSIKWLAHRVQLPNQKINHSLVMGGPQGIGKDSMLAPVRYAVGTWNFYDVSPTHLLGRFNNFAKSVILRVDEARDLGDVDRFKFYDHTKIYTAAPPEVLRVDEKFLREHYVFNVLSFIITTNHKTDGIYLPADDRRHFVAWSDCTKEEFTPDYWNELWGWYENGGFGHVTAYLTELDISDFDPNAPPPKTPAFWDIVNASKAPEDSELADVIDKITGKSDTSGNPTRPDALHLKLLIAAATDDILEWLMNRKNRRAIPHRLERCGYISVHNPEAKDGFWKLQGVRQIIYAKTSLSLQERVAAARKL